MAGWTATTTTAQRTRKACSTLQHFKNAEGVVRIVEVKLVLHFPFSSVNAFRGVVETTSTVNGDPPEPSKHNIPIRLNAMQINYVSDLRCRRQANVSIPYIESQVNPSANAFWFMLDLASRHDLAASHQIESLTY